MRDILRIEGGEYGKMPLYVAWGLKSAKISKYVNCYFTECVTDLDKQSEIIIFRSILTTFEIEHYFWRQLGSIENWPHSTTEPPMENLAWPNR